MGVVTLLMKCLGEGYVLHIELTVVWYGRCYTRRSYSLRGGIEWGILTHPSRPPPPKHHNKPPGLISLLYNAEILSIIITYLLRWTVWSDLCELSQSWKRLKLHRESQVDNNSVTVSNSAPHGLNNNILTYLSAGHTQSTTSWLVHP